MMVSRRARFAIHGLLYLAKKGDGQPISFRQILDYLKSWSLELSLSSGYVAKIFQDLSRAGLVRSIPGRKGGYLLARAPEHVHLIEVLNTLDGIAPPDCCFLSVGECTLQDHCGLSKVLEKARTAFYAVLEGENLLTLSGKMALPPEHAQKTPL